MTGGDGGNAMTEIALALAMAFFAIMILTMVSMGGQGRAKETLAARADAEPLRLLAPAPQDGGGQGARGPRILAPRQLIIFSGGRFLDTKLQVLGPAALAAMKRPVLALSPALSLAEVMAAKDRLALPGLTVTALDRRWLEAIKEHAK
jgi:hypothetical protein